MAAVNVAEKRRGLSPPGHLRIQVRAGEILLAGNAGFVGRADESVPDEAVHAFAQRLVEGRLEVVPDFFLPVRADGGEAFVLRDEVAVGVRGAGGLLDKKTVFVADAVLPTTRPKIRSSARRPSRGSAGRQSARRAARRIRDGFPGRAGARCRGTDGNDCQSPGRRASGGNQTRNGRSPRGYSRCVRPARAARATVVAAALLKFRAQGRRPIGQLRSPNCRCADISTSFRPAARRRR